MPTIQIPFSILKCIWSCYQLFKEFNSQFSFLLSNTDSTINDSCNEAFISINMMIETLNDSTDDQLAMKQLR